MKKLLFGVCLLFTGVIGYSQKASTFIESGKAIRGYDPVAYFTQQKAVKGNEKFSYQWNGAAWHFASRENLDLFISNPAKYAPQYGGYCAYGLSNGYKAPTEPDAWTIENGKLYLNYDLNVRTLWSKEKKERIAKADQNWPRIKDKG